VLESLQAPRRVSATALSLSTLADLVGACTTALQPLYALIERHVLTAERLHGDDTTVPIPARGKTVKGRIWTYVRDDRPFAGRAPPAALYYASRDRRQEHPARHLHGFNGILQADPTAATTSSTTPRTLEERSPQLCVGRTRGGSSSCSRRSRGMLGVGSTRRPSRRSRSKRSSASTRSSRSNAASTGKAGAPGRCATCGRARSFAARAAIPALTLVLGCRTDRLMLRRWDRFARFIDDGRVCLTEQRGRTGATRICAGAQVMAVRWFGTRCRPRCRHGDADHDCQDE